MSVRDLPAIHAKGSDGEALCGIVAKWGLIFCQVPGEVDCKRCEAKLKRTAGTPPKGGEWP